MNRGRQFAVPVLLAATLAGRAGDAAGDPLRLRAVPSGGPLAAEPAGGQQAADCDEPTDDRTLYLTGMVGSSFATEAGTGSLGGRLFTGEAAIGVSIPRPTGSLRFEFEGRQRAARSGERSAAGPDGQLVTTSIDGEWTTLANAWRDLALTEHLGLYAGGGIGIGGERRDVTGPTVADAEPRPAAPPGGPGRVTDFAWQAGGGATYAVTDRVTFDAGYRFYGVGTGPAGRPAGELLFAVRISDPFRGWLRR